MQSIVNLLNQIKWDKRKNPKEYLIYYLDRISNKEIEIPFTKIKNFNKSFLTINDKEIPMHRIKKVKKKDKIIWER